MKTYTTIEMIDALKVGHEAEAIEPIKNVIVKKNSDGTIIVLHDDYSDKYVQKPLPMTGTVLKAKWVFRKKPISFMEAAQHIKNGKKARCIMEGENEGTVYDNIDDIIYFHEALEGKWYLEEQNE